jgi:hypothetical protein
MDRWSLKYMDSSDATNEERMNPAVELALVHPGEHLLETKCDKDEYQRRDGGIT